MTIADTNLVSSNIRRATVADSKLVATLNLSVQQLHHDHDPETYKPPNLQATQDWLERLLADDDTTAFIAEDGNHRPIGYVLLVLKRIGENPFRKAGQYIELDQIGVDPKYRRQGIGEALYRHAIAHCRNSAVREVRLTVIDFNEVAQQFYESLGFTLSNRRMSLALE